VLRSDLDYATAGEGVDFGLDGAMLTLSAGLKAGSIEWKLKQGLGALPPRWSFFMFKRGGEVTINGGESS